MATLLCNCVLLRNKSVLECNNANLQILAMESFFISFFYKADFSEINLITAKFLKLNMTS